VGVGMGVGVDVGVDVGVGMGVGIPSSDEGVAALVGWIRENQALQCNDQVAAGTQGPAADSSHCSAFRTLSRAVSGGVLGVLASESSRHLLGPAWR